ncbi:hypothetical protein FRC15_007848 [Serendipita sp. 397]|nr:hypothetical protein FRC15_007848 [Serendipita sp. 397]
MASGYGINGGQSRCFPFWQAVAKVMHFPTFVFDVELIVIQCYAETDRPGNCTLMKEDYIECLHHRKARAREQTIRRESNKVRTEGLEEANRQAEIYKSMGPAGVHNVALVERILTKGAMAAEKGAKSKGSKKDPQPNQQQPLVDFEPFSIVDRDGQKYVQVPGNRKSEKEDGTNLQQDRARVDFEVVSPVGSSKP